VLQLIGHAKILRLGNGNSQHIALLFHRNKLIPVHQFNRDGFHEGGWDPNIFQVVPRQAILISQDLTD
jgi:hypothetical protein